LLLLMFKLLCAINRVHVMSLYELDHLLHCLTLL
jgi:hypothetical protein